MPLAVSADFADSPARGRAPREAAPAADPVPVPLSVAASAPGKLILAGEHAVVYGRPALVAAVDLRLTARFSSLPASSADPANPAGARGAHGHPAAPGEPEPEPARRRSVRLDLPRLGLVQEVSWAEIAAYAAAARERWERFAASPNPESFRALRGSDPLHLVKVALGEAARSLGEVPGEETGPPLGDLGGEAVGPPLGDFGDEAGLPLGNLGGEADPPLAVRVDSELPAGSGMGSSAAAAVALVAGYLAFRGALHAPAAGARGARGEEASRRPGRPQVPETARVPEIPVLAAIERLAFEVERRQHGSPSGVDVATVLRGGLLWVERRGDGTLAPAPLAAVAARSPLLAGLAAYHTGEPPEPTGEVVAAVAARRAAAPTRVEAALDRIADGTRALASLLAGPAADPAGMVEVLRAVEAALEELGVVPAAVREVVRRVEAEGGAAKISGAGSLAGPAAGMLLVYHPDPERAAAWPFLSAFGRLPLRLGAPGLRLEPSR